MAITKTVPTSQTSSILLSGQQVVSKQLELSSYNISNMTTPAFKGLMVDTRSVQYQPRPDASPVSYVETTPITRNFIHGGFNHTGNTFDLGITQKGYFQVAGGKLTRNGRFNVDVNGKLLTSRGDAVLSDGGSEISIPLNVKKVLIGPDGTIATEHGIVGKVGVFNVPDEHKLKSVGYGEFTSDVPATVVSAPDIVQGAFEGSNVELVGELTRLIKVQEMFKEHQNIAIRDEEQRKQLIRLSPKLN